jgi:polyisoprenoid-binding protein YceI
MALRFRIRIVPLFALASLLAAAAIIPLSGATPLAIDTARITINGTSNIHPYTASTTAVHVTRLQLGNAVAGPAFWDEIVKPGGLTAFEIAIPAATLTSPKEGLDKNMHKALRTAEFAEITFRLLRVQPGDAGTLKATGLLKIAGQEREIALDLKTLRKDSALAVSGQAQLLMTDFGIKPPTAMLGMLKTDPKVTITFETVLTIPLT